MWFAGMRGRMISEINSIRKAGSKTSDVRIRSERKNKIKRHSKTRKKITYVSCVKIQKKKN